MNSKIQKKRSQGKWKPTLVVLVVYSILCFHPWKGWLNSMPWVQFSLGFLLFLVPGLGIQLLISGEKIVLRPHILTQGFAISITLTSFLGLFARWIDLTFNWILAGFYLVGAIGLVAATSQNDLRLIRPSKPSKKELWLIFIVISVLVLILVAANAAIPPLIYEDDFTYNAQLNYFLTAESYDSITAMENMEPARFRLSFWPLVEAVLSHSSGLHGLLVTGIYIAPVLVFFSGLVLYVLGRSFGFSRPVALVAVSAQITSLIRLTMKNQPGVLFFNRFPEDKVVAAFVLAPIVFKLAFEYLEVPHKKNLALLLGVTLALGFTHPVMLGYTGLIIGLGGFMYSLKQQRFQSLVPVILVLGAVISMPLAIRVFERDHLKEFTMTESLEAGRENKLNPGRLTVLENEFFYGVSLEIMKGLPYDLLLLAGVVSLIQLNKSTGAIFIAASLITLGLATFPYTGWIIGYALSPFQLWRLTWLMPFGISIGFILMTASHWLFQQFPKLKAQKHIMESILSFGSALVFLLGALYILPWAKGNLDFGGRKPGFTAWYQDYIEMAGYLDPDQTRDAVFLGGADRTTNDIIPSLYPGVSLVSFRNERGGNTASLWEEMVGEGAAPPQRLESYLANDVKYLLIREEPEWLEELLAASPDQFSLIHENRKLRLFELTP